MPKKTIRVKGGAKSGRGPGALDSFAVGFKDKHKGVAKSWDSMAEVINAATADSTKKMFRIPVVPNMQKPKK